MLSLPYILTAILVLLTTAFLRLLYILPAFHRTRPPPRTRGTPTHLLIVLGSGGHTAEMLSLLAGLDPKTHTHRSYVISSGDDFSACKAEVFERSLPGKEDGVAPKTNYCIHEVPRARRIHQSLLSTLFTSLRCLVACLALIHYHPKGHPDLILVNGPATSLILILAATILHYFSFLPSISSPRSSVSGEPGSGIMRTIYVESWARVKRPSLSGRIIVLCGLCDRVLVQWKELEIKGWGEYRGMLVR